jgi:hypothetical protein
VYKQNFMAKSEASYAPNTADTALEMFDRDLIALAEVGLIELVESDDGKLRFNVTGRAELAS